VLKAFRSYCWGIQIQTETSDLVSLLLLFPNTNSRLKVEEEKNEGNRRNYERIEMNDTNRGR
jgi:hypothetical protein